MSGELIPDLLDLNAAQIEQLESLSSDINKIFGQDDSNIILGMMIDLIKCVIPLFVFFFLTWVLFIIY